jgi:multiple sugar transport system permease protein
MTKHGAAAWILAGPALLVIAVFFALPVVAGLALSLTDFDIYALADLSTLRFVGLQNYAHLLQTPLFWQALGNTLYFVVVGVPVSIGLSLLAALLLDSRFARWQPFFRTSLFAPVVTTAVAVAVIWRYLLHTRYGLVNQGLEAIGLAPVDWLGDPHWSMPAIIAFAAWKNFGYNMIILLAALQAVPRELYEAARMDGAGVGDAALRSRRSGAAMNPRLAVWLVNGLLAALAASTLFPLLWMLSASLMAPGASTSLPTPILPPSLTLENYRTLFGSIGMGRYLLNSLLIATVATAISVSFNLMAGYAFAKLKFRGRDLLFRLLLGALVIPGQVAMLPLFLMLKPLGLIDSYGGAIVPAMASVFGIFLVRQFARGIPDELLEAARIDGAGELRIFTTVVVPLLKPIVATLAVFSFLATWNDFMWPLIVLTDDSLHTLPVALAGLSREHVQDNELMMAGSVITVLPVLLLFLALQRQYLEGLLAGSVKG